MRTPVKVGLVVAGHVGAFGVASAVVAAHVAMTNGPDRQGASGMYAFGDSLFFLAAFGVAAVPATGAALFFLRLYRRFWLGLSVAAIVIATTGLAALVSYVGGRSAGPGSALQYLAGLLQGFDQKLESQKVQLREEHGLIWLGDPLLKEYFRHVHPHLRKTSSSGVHRGADFVAGLRDGKEITIRRGIGGESVSRGRLLEGGGRRGALPSSQN